MKLKKVLLRGVTTFAVLIAVVVIFRIQIFNALEPLITSNMFVAEDTDSYDPGLPIGAQFPPIEAVYEGRQITAIDEFVGTRGALFVANRSVVW